MNEIWKDIPNYENLYQISNMGRVRSLHGRYKGKTYLKPSVNSKGYLSVSLCKDHNQKSVNIHRLVAEAFVDNPYGFPCVNHKDENKTNNCAENLEWCSFQYNNVYGHRLEKSALSRGIPVRCIETGTVYQSAYYAQRVTGVNQSGISECCNGKAKTAGGFHWEFV